MSSMNIKNIADIVRPTGLIVFVSGVTGQDGSLMVDYLLKNTDHAIIGGARRLSVENHINIKHLENEPRFQLVNFDLTDPHSIYKLMEVAAPDYFINFAAQSFVASSWDFAHQTWTTNSTAILNCLEAIRKVKPICRFYNAGSSEEFGNIQYSPQDENHPARPRSPYGASKCAARTLVKVYRESYDLYAVQGWLFNHEGHRRGAEFVTRKISKGVARISLTIESCKRKHLNFIEPITLGNLDAKRDWSDAEDLMDAVWRMLNQEVYNKDFPIHQKSMVSQIKDYVVASGESHSIREFVEEAFKVVGITGRWFIDMKKDPLTERFVYFDDGIVVPDLQLVSVNSKFYRPAEVDVLLGNPALIEKELGWKRKTDFNGLVKKMVENDLKNI
jgi:GDPmannose 4,6-dehydratase